MTTLTKIAQEWAVSEDLLHDLTQQMDTEDGVICVYGTDVQAVLALSEDGIERLQNLLAEYRGN